MIKFASHSLRMETQAPNQSELGLGSSKALNQRGLRMIPLGFFDPYQRVSKT